VYAHGRPCASSPRAVDGAARRPPPGPRRGTGPARVPPAIPAPSCRSRRYALAPSCFASGPPGAGSSSSLGAADGMSCASSRDRQGLISSCGSMPFRRCSSRGCELSGWTIGRRPTSSTSRRRPHSQSFVDPTCGFADSAWAFACPTARSQALRSAPILSWDREDGHRRGSGVSSILRCAVGGFRSRPGSTGGWSTSEGRRGRPSPPTLRKESRSMSVSQDLRQYGAWFK